MKSIFLPLGIVLAASLTILSSISFNFFSKQAIFICIGVLLIFLFRRFGWHVMASHSWFVIGFYGLAVALLILVLVVGPSIRNVRSWLVLGPISIQPAELAKVALILLYADYFSRRHLTVARWKIILGSFAFFLVPAVLVGLQPALGSAAVLFSIWFGFLLTSGLPRRRLALALVVFAAAGAVLWNWGMKDYQRARVVHFFYPERNLLGTNYSVAQSKIAIGSAGWFGKGYGQGSQTQLGFLTEPAHDFVLAAFIEEWGILGGIAVIAAFLALLLRILKIGLASGRNFEKFVCLGSVIAFGTQFFLNAGSALGLVPVVGLPFPFLSYGGSALLTGFALIALISAIEQK